MNVGDVYTVEGVYVRQSWWLLLKRRLGFRVPEPRLREWVVVQQVAPAAWIAAANPASLDGDLSLTAVWNQGLEREQADRVIFNPSDKGTNIAL